MGGGTDTSSVQIGRATHDDIDLVAQVLEEASAWLRRRGIEQWPATFPTEWLGPPIERGETWLAIIDGTAAGTLTLTGRDPAWPDDDIDATYVHRLAVRRSFAGLGLVLLDWAASEARSRSHSCLRLDCDASNGRLRHYYEAARFRTSGEAVVHGIRVTLFERSTRDAQGE
jgi:GNAT superfamily N-acetyltransferase